MNKIIYLILEVKKRELDSRCYLAIKSCLKNYTVFIAKKESFYRNKNYFKKGFVFLKSNGPNYYKEIMKIHALGHKICVMDEEGLMYFSEEDYIQRRIFEKNLDFINYIFSWGEDDYKILTKGLKNHNNKIFMTGSPRIDILKNPVSNIYAREAKQINQKFGNFFLFNTFFCFVNHFFSSDENRHLEILQSKGFSEKSLVYTNGLEMRNLQSKVLEEAKKFVKIFGEKFKNNKLIIRPHPSEKHDIWHDFAKKYNNVETVYDDRNACSWILASNFAISSNCTTSVEAFLLNKLNYNFRPAINENVEFNLPKITGINVSSADNMLDIIKNYNSNKTDEIKFEKKLKEILPNLKNYFHNLESNNCSVDNMLNIISKGIVFDEEEKDEFSSYNINFIYLKFLRKLNYYRTYLASFFDKDIRAEINFSSQKFPDLTKKELEEKIKKISTELNINKNFQVTEKFPGAFLIKKIG